MKVLKFGGTSVQNSAAINQVFDIVKKENDKIVVVVSAMSGVTNQLVNIIDNLKTNNLEKAIENINFIKNKHLTLVDDLDIKNESIDFINTTLDQLLQLIKALNVLGEISKRSEDLVYSIGEILSSKLIYNYFLKKGLKISHIDSREIVKTDNSFTEANVNFELSYKLINEKVLESFRQNDILICGGFIGSTLDNITTTLGRGGSDYSAAIIAGAINAKELQIWTDVDGILTSDPRHITNVKLINQISYDEASELAYFGAKVLHPKTIFPAIDKKIPVKVLNTFNTKSNGTKILASKSSKKMIKAIAFRKGVSVINIISNRMLGAYGFLSKVFEIFNKFQTSVDLITTSEVSVSLTIDDKTNLHNIKKELSKFAKIEILDNCSIIATIGNGIKNKSGLAGQFFSVLKDINIYMVSIGASEVNISIVVKEDDTLKAVELLHNKFLTNVVDNEIFSIIG